MEAAGEHVVDDINARSEGVVAAPRMIRRMSRRRRVGNPRWPPDARREWIAATA